MILTLNVLIMDAGVHGSAVFGYSLDPAGVDVTKYEMVICSIKWISQKNI